MNAKIVKYALPVAHLAWVYGGRVFHLVMRRRVLRVVGGLSIMYGASLMMEYQPEWAPKMVWESAAFFVHGVGSIPFLKPLEPVFVGEAKTLV